MAYYELRDREILTNNYCLVPHCRVIFALVSISDDQGQEQIASSLEL